MPGFRCETCALNVNSQQQFSQHLSGKAHLKRVKEKNISAGTWDPLKLIAESPRLYGSFVKSSESIKNEPVQQVMPQQSQPVQPPQPQQSQPPAPPQQSQAQLTQPQQSQPPAPPQQSQTQLAQPQQSQQPPPPPQSQAQLTQLQQLQPQQPPPLPPAPSKTTVNPVVQAVVDNALGVLPTKRKLYQGRCEICKIQFNSQSQESQHYQGGKHAKKLKLAQDNTAIKPASSFTCQYCNVTVNSLQQFSAHTEGTKHKANVQKCKNDQISMRIAPLKVVTTEVQPTGTTASVQQQVVGSVMSSVSSTVTTMVQPAVTQQVVSSA